MISLYNPNCKNFFQDANDNMTTKKKLIKLQYTDAVGLGKKVSISNQRLLQNIMWPKV